MPLYEYKCQVCGERFERLLPRKQADQQQECPKCGSKRVTRVFSAFATRSKSASCAPSG